MYMI